ncbi:MAG: LytTR family DNA-binding domain-containing protein [Bacteroidetes bacterium]|nr:LytTR family DNA-binding domain-containing protein [Bacteroidota bacterium]
MNAIIIEDEKLSAEHLCNLLKKIDPTIRVVDTFDSIRETVDAFQKGARADLLFVDIQLSDGLSFDIFSKITTDTPVIFTTAYDEYAIRAFKLNSVDYLLKPVGLEELRGAIEKFKKYNRSDYSIMLGNIVQAYQTMNRQYKNRFMIRMGETIVSVKTGDIAHFIFEDGIVLLVTNTNHLYPVDFTLEQLEPLLDPGLFFRINRKVIVNIDAIQKSGTYFNSRLKITTPLLHADNSIVSRERVTDFKEWLGR